MKEIDQEVEIEIFTLLIGIIVNAMNIVSNTGEIDKEMIYKESF